jgi:hypothetical protein
MPEPKPRKKQRSLDTTTAEAQALNAIQEPVGQLKRQAIESGFRIDKKGYMSRLDAEVGFWNARYRGKVTTVTSAAGPAHNLTIELLHSGHTEADTHRRPSLP